jgi:hypothetical protein
MAQDLSVKRKKLIPSVVNQAQSLLQAADLAERLKLALTQAGGGFQDDDFAAPANAALPDYSYLQAYEPNVFLHITIPALDAFLDSSIAPNDSPPSTTTHRMILYTVLGLVQ